MRTVNNPTPTERVTFRLKEGERAQTILIEGVRESTILGAPCIVGYEIDKDGTRWFGTDTATARFHVLETAMIVRRVPVVMDLDTGEYVNA